MSVLLCLPRGDVDAYLNGIRGFNLHRVSGIIRPPIRRTHHLNAPGGDFAPLRYP